MKKYSKIYLLIALLFSLIIPTGCNKQLDLAPENTLVDRDVFKSAMGTEQALAEGYNNLRTAVTGSFAYVFSDFSTTNLHHSPFYEVYTNGEATPVDDNVTAIWTNYFRAINTANNIIANIALYAEYEEAKQEQFIAEARFIRAYCYLDLLKMYGDGALTGNMQGLGLPLQLTPFKGYNTGEVIPRSTNGQVYTQIVNDLNEIKSILPERQTNELATRSRATRGGANALLARTLLYMGEFENALIAANDVLAQSPAVYQVASNILTVFPENEDGGSKSLTPEHILAIPVSYMVSSSTSINNNLGNGYFFKRSFWINQDFMALFEPGDLRVSTLMFKGDQVFNVDHLNEFTTFKFNSRNGRDNVPLIRLPEILLIAAEAITREQGVQNSAINYLNTVRNRANPGITPYTIADFPDPNGLIEAIMDERRFELAFEGFYRYDLIRTNKPLKNTSLAEGRKVLPVPQIEIDISAGIIQQNSGY